MTSSRLKKRSRSAYEVQGVAVCSACGGSGRVTNQNWLSRSRKGGNRSYMKSLEPGALSMRDRGKLGGRPRLPTLADIEAEGEGPGREDYGKEAKALEPRPGPSQPQVGNVSVNGARSSR